MFHLIFTRIFTWLSEDDESLQNTYLDDKIRQKIAHCHD